MSGAKFADEFKRAAVAQVEDRGYPVREVAERLGVRRPAGECEAIAERQHQVDLHLAEAVFAACESDPGGRCSGRRDPPPQARFGGVTSGRDILKKRPHTSPGNPPSRACKHVLPVA